MLQGSTSVIDLPLDRLPTISASQALQSLKSSLPRSISTGLDRLDVLLQGPAARQNEHHSKGGLLRGQVTEVYGPPGVGKTTIGYASIILHGVVSCSGTQLIMAFVGCRYLQMH